MRAKPVRWIAEEIEVPPFAETVALEVGALLEVVALGGMPTMPRSRPMPAIGSRCHELRVNDRNKAWRVIYHIADDAIVVLEVFAKKTQATPRRVIDRCKRRLRRYEEEHRMV